MEKKKEKKVTSPAGWAQAGEARRRRDDGDMFSFLLTHGREDREREKKRKRGKLAVLHRHTPVFPTAVSRWWIFYFLFIFFLF